MTRVLQTKIQPKIKLLLPVVNLQNAVIITFISNIFQGTLINNLWNLDSNNLDEYQCLTHFSRIPG